MQATAGLQGGRAGPALIHGRAGPAGPGARAGPEAGRAQGAQTRQGTARRHAVRARHQHKGLVAGRARAEGQQLQRDHTAQHQRAYLEAVVGRQSGIRGVRRRAVRRLGHVVQVR